MKEICERRGGVRVIRSEKQLGIGGSRARLYEEARGRFICSLDADIIFTDTDPHWLERLRSLWASGDGAFGILTALLLWPRGTVQAAGACVDLASTMGFRLRGTDEPAGDVANSPALVAAASGACQFFHQSLLDQCQIDSAYFPTWYDDADFCFQARAAGYGVRYSPEVRIIHNAQSWCGSAEAKRQAQPEAVKARFMEHWRDMAEQDERLQDETGALGYPAPAPKFSAYTSGGCGANEHLGLAVNA